MSINIDQMRDKVRALTYDMQELTLQQRQYNIAAGRGLYLLNQLGMPQNIRQAISYMHTLVMTANQLRVALHALQLAYLSSGPVGWVLFGVTAAATAFTVYNEWQSFQMS